MKNKLLFVLNHLEFSNGVAAVLKNLLLNIDYDKYEIHVLPLYKCDMEFCKPFIDKIKLLKGFGNYFRGLDKILKLIPLKLLYKKFIKEQYDLLIAFQYGLPTKLVSINKNQKKICWIHTYDTNLTLRKYYEKYDKIVSVARVGRDKLIKDGLPAKKCMFCYNIIDEDKIYNLSKDSINFKPNNKFHVVTVARMDNDKGYYRMVKCINDNKKLLTNIEFWFIGAGNESSIVQEFVDSNNLTEYVKIFGAQKNPYPYIANADLYYCFSFREGFSTSCQEAAILGKPIISVNVDGADEAIELSKSGIVVDNSEDSIAMSFENYLLNDVIINEWRANSELNKRNFFKQERIMRIESLFDELLNS